MAKQVCLGAQMRCTLGTGASNLIVTSQFKSKIQGRPVATIFDHAPNQNVPPFGLCLSLANPAVAAATSAAAGVLTPQPCTPVTPGPWVPASLRSKASGKPLLQDNACLQCAWAGRISITNPNQTSGDGN